MSPRLIFPFKLGIVTGGDQEHSTPLALGWHRGQALGQATRGTRKGVTRGTGVCSHRWLLGHGFVFPWKPRNQWSPFRGDPENPGRFWHHRPGAAVIVTRAAGAIWALSVCSRGLGSAPKAFLPSQRGFVAALPPSTVSAPPNSHPKSTHSHGRGFFQVGEWIYTRNAPKSRS